MDADQVDRGPLATVHRVDGTVVVLDASHADVQAAGLDRQFVAHAAFAATDAARHHRAVSGNGK
jgi:hypothetical protein